ncbi:hypothetical protein FGK63_17895 [Ruegeria sediminis]|uniref:Uncharacterized protein n=1 Tax=Ruegeria sediminis TaxID=2583820 RepID=A0ABY2WV67_9RHOB|nr:hypothetical protein [Ruegeria sediminis]TMV04949.1 hypothetical protein FGK63_17895 [Ruegeria sediminis]
MQNSLTRRSVKAAAAFGIAMLLSSTDAPADQSDAENAVDTFDKAMLSIFRRSQDQLTAETRPIMVIARDVTVISDEGEATYPRNAPRYQQLKSTSHVLLGIIGAVTPWPEGEAGKQRWRRDFSSIATEIDALLAAIDGLGLSEEALASQRKMLGTARSFTENALNQDELTREAVSKVINDMRPAWVENMREAARAELTALHAAVSQARAAMDEADWARMYVVHHGGSSVKNVNVVLLYLQRVMPEKVAAGQVLFAENAHGKDALARHAGYVRMQRHVGAWAFGDPGRMEVDLLGYEAGAILDEMIPATPPVAAAE